MAQKCFGERGLQAKFDAGRSLVVEAPEIIKVGARIIRGLFEKRLVIAGVQQGGGQRVKLRSGRSFRRFSRTGIASA